MANHYVVGLDVAVNDARTVCCVQRRCYLQSDLEC